jgi:hypothetical protein
MRRRRLVPLAATLALAAAACSSGGSSNVSNAGTTTTHVAPSTSTTGKLPDLGPATIHSFTGPRSPVLCTAPTEIELHWRTPVTATVELRIDGGDVFATYPGGKGVHLVPLACDGRSQTYELTVRGPGGTTATRTLTIDERLPA